ncbi:MAG: photosynthetic reaction center cytochrome c subunit [Chloroflexi bacterium]|nr:photosynthetic reaction center cytochrome c subunit [Chloroflexota bacterium]
MLDRILKSNSATTVTFWIVTIVLVLSSFWVISFVYGQTQDEDEVVVDEALSAIYVDYYNSADQFVSAESYLAMGEYTAQFPQPQNVQILTNMTTTEITGYMLNHFSAGMGVDCTYCHSLENFAADEWDDEVAMARKTTALEHLELTADLNRNWLTQLAGLTETKRPSGAQITCTTCHNGEPLPDPWPEDGPLDEDLRLPLDADTVFSVEEEGILNVNARKDISLDTVQYNQEVMYHMNTSLGVGCTHCHNSRYFPSYEGVPAKNYTINMLQMSQHLWNNYEETLGGKQPSCYLCHQGAPIPPGAARSVDVMPDALVANQ